MIDNPRLKSNLNITKIDQKLLHVISDHDIITLSDPLEIDVLEEIGKGKFSTQELAQNFFESVRFHFNF